MCGDGGVNPANDKSKKHLESTTEQPQQVASPSSDVECKHEPKHANQDRWKSNFDRVVSAATLLVLIATFFAALFAGMEADRLANLTHDVITHSDKAADRQHLDTLAAISKAGRANDIFQDTEKRQLRAYIGVQPATIGADAGQMFLKFYFHNYGHTPAYRLRSEGGHAVAHFPMHHNERFAVHPTRAFGYSVTAFPQNDPPHDARVPLPYRVGEEFSQEIAAGLVLYVYGRVDYYDAFGESHYTVFCTGVTFQDLLRIGIPTKGQDTVQFLPCPEIYDRAT